MEMDIHHGSILPGFDPVAVGAPGDLNPLSKGLATRGMQTGPQHTQMPS